MSVGLVRFLVDLIVLLHLLLMDMEEVNIRL